MATENISGFDKPISIVRVVGPDGSNSAFTVKRQYTLLTNASATGQQVGPVDGGDYIWRAEAGNWNGATATLQFLGLDASTWFPVRNAANTADVTLTANGQIGIGVAQGSILRVAISGGPPTAVNSALGGL